MPARLLEDPLGIDCVFSDGRRARRVIKDAAPIGLVRDLLVGLAEIVHPHGTVDSLGTLDFYLVGLRDMAAFMHAAGVHGGAAGLTRGRLAEYWMQTERGRESTTRRMLASFDAAAGGVLQPGVRTLVDGRPFTRPLRGSPVIPYSQQEWDRLHQICRHNVDESFTVHRQASSAAAHGEDPRVGGWNPANQRWLLARLGPCTDRQIGEYLGCAGWSINDRGGIRTASDELFPNVNVRLTGGYDG
jgi:hypothetical protein